MKEEILYISKCKKYKIISNTDGVFQIIIKISETSTFCQNFSGRRFIYVYLKLLKKRILRNKYA